MQRSCLMDTNAEELSSVPVAAVSVVPRVSWAAIFAGAFISIGTWMLLHILGLGIGLTAIDPNDPNSLRGVGIGTGLWSLIAPILALFVGGLVMGRLAGPLHRFRGAIHGAILWSVVTVVSMLLLVTALSALVGNAARVGMRTTAGIAGAGQSVDLADLNALGLSGDDLLAPVNRRLAAEGKPTVSASQVTAAARDALRRSVRQGRVDRATLVSALAANTPLTRNDAEEVAATITQRWNQEYAAAGASAQRLQEEALQAAETTGKALVGFFFALLLALASAIAGATVGVVREYSHPTGVGATPATPTRTGVVPS
jgi:hypothetical protein